MAWMVYLYIVKGADELHQLRRVNRSIIIVSVKLNTCNLTEPIATKAIFSPAKSKIVSFRRLVLLQDGNRFFNFVCRSEKSIFL